MRIDSGLLPGHVLQRTPRGASAAVGGIATASGPVVATIRARGKPLRGWKAKRVGAARGGSFRARLAGIPTGGPYEIEIAVGRERARVRGVFVGDLWLLAGQSNMEGVGNLADAPRPHPLARCFTMARRWEAARDPLHHLGESPDAVHNGGRQEAPAVAAKLKRDRLKGSGVGVWFAREMIARTGVPQGLIATAHGGTSMEQWDPAKRGLGGGSLYGSMLASLAAVGQPLAGVLWYQGESDANASAAPLYAERMRGLIAAIRADQRQPRLPFSIVQIGRVVGHADDGRDWNVVQEAERRLPETVRGVDVVAAVDLELDDAIHISGRDYATLAARMARGMARLAHGDRRERPAPRPVSARILTGYRYGQAVEVRFADVVGGLRAGGLPLGFAIVDGQHRRLDLITKTILDGDRAILELTDLDRGDVRVMYGHGKNPACNLVDARGMAVPVCGPLPLVGTEAVSAWMVAWDVSAVRAGEGIAAMPRPEPEAFAPLERRTWHGGKFVDQHDRWQGRSGHAALFTEVECAEDMRVELRTGYDGPFRLWVDGKEVHRDLKGTNPAIADRVRLPLRLTRGRHRLTVLMALNDGRAWGFFVRFGRPDVGAEALASGAYRMPVPVA